MARASQLFIARQPITDRAGDLRGYELLFRGASADLEAIMADATRATARLLTDGVLVDGLGSLTGGLPAFVNFTETLLVGDFGLALRPVDGFVVELARDVQPTHKVLAACRRLRSRGVPVAVDDIEDASRLLDFEGNVDFAKVDIMAAKPNDLAAIMRVGRRHHLRLLATNVESHARYEAACQSGFDYFQGWAIGRPALVSRASFPGIPAAHFHLLRALRDPNVSVSELDQLVMADPSLAYRLLRYANSARAAQVHPVTSIHRALLLFGQAELRRAVELLILSGLSSLRSPLLLLQAVTRARFCETTAFRLQKGDQCPDYALVGLFSNLDLLLGIPLQAALANVPLDAVTLAALLRREGSMGEVLGLAIAYEAGNWDEVRRASKRLGLNENLLPAVSFQSVRNAHHLVSAA